MKLGACKRCGWLTSTPPTCSSCITVKAPVAAHLASRNAELARALRLARACLKTGRNAEALAVLEHVT